MHDGIIQNWTSESSANADSGDAVDDDAADVTGEDVDNAVEDFADCP